MKNLLKSLLISLTLLPSFVFGATAVGWNTPTITTGWILPNAVNGTNQIIFAKNGLFSIASSTFSSNLFLSSLTQGVLFTGSNGIVKTVATSTPTVTAPITYSGTLGSFLSGVSGTFGCTSASSGVTGCLTGTDWDTFNNKVATTRTITVAGTSNQITSSAGAQDLSANRTWTLSFPNLIINPQASTTVFSNLTKAYFGASATTTIDSAGNIVIPSGSNLTVTGKSDGCATWATGVLNSTGSACGSGGGTSAFEIATSSTLNLSDVLYVSKVSGRTTLAGVATSSIASGTNITVTNGSTAFVLGAQPTINLSGVVAYANGGTGTTTAPQSQLLYGGSTAYQSVATSSIAVGASITSSGTLGAQVGGTASSLSINLANPNIWTVLQSFNYSSSTIYSSFVMASSTRADLGTLFLPNLSQGIAYIGSNGKVNSTATSTFSLSQFTNDLATLTATDASLTFSGSYNGATARTVGLNLGNANTWTVNQTFNYSSSTIYSSFATASSTNLFLGTGQGLLYVGSNALVRATATTSASCSGTVSCSSFTILGSSPITLTGSSSGGGGSPAWATTSPYAGGLVLYPADQTNEDVVFGSNAGSTTTAPFWWDVSATSTYIGNGGTGTSTLSLSGGTGTDKWWNLGSYSNSQAGVGNFFISSSSSDSDITTNQFFTITQAGLIGIGSSTPFKTLSVGSGNTGTIAISTTTNGCLQATKGELWITGTACGTSSGLTSYDAFTHPAAGQSATTSLMMLFGNASTTGLSANYAEFGKSATTTFTATGNIGISTTSPWARLSISPQVGETSLIIGSSSPYLIVNTTGNVGIGTTSPSKLLYVFGNQTGGIARIHRQLSATTGLVGTLDFLAESTGQMTDNFAAGLNFLLQDADGVVNTAGQLYAYRTGTDNSGGLQFSTFSGGNAVSSLYLHPIGIAAFGTSTAFQYGVTIASSTVPQLSLSAGAGLNQWVFGNIGGNFYLSTTTVAGNATSSPALTILGSSGLFGIGTSTPFCAFCISPPSGTYPFYIGSTTKPYFAINGAGAIMVNAVQPATSTTQIIDWNNTPPQVEIQIGTSATTIKLINATTSAQWGSVKTVWVCNPTSTAGALSWTGVQWIGTAPTQTTTANKCDIYNFNITRATSTPASPSYLVAGNQGAGL